MKAIFTELNDTITLKSIHLSMCSVNELFIGLLKKNLNLEKLRIEGGHDSCIDFINQGLQTNNALRVFGLSSIGRNYVVEDEV
jgi:hypothetical protein